MKGLIILIALSLLVLFYPPPELHCWDNAGIRSGSWTETTCEGHLKTGTWRGYITNDCNFIGAGKWESVNGIVDPTTGVFTATGTNQEGCGTVTISGFFNSNLQTVSGTYNFSKGGNGKFEGKLER